MLRLSKNGLEDQALPYVWSGGRRQCRKTHVFRYEAAFFSHGTADHTTR